MRRLLVICAAVLLLMLALALFRPSPIYAGCRPEPASQWAPAGYVCDPHYGIGTASTWQGPGSAVNSCSYPWTDCQTIAVQSLDTGLVIVTRPTMYCHCWVGVTGPNGETERLVDLGPELVAALGLPGPGLYDVKVWPVTTLPDTAYGG